MASIAPLLTNNSSPSVISLFAYLLVVTAGALWVVWITGWTRIIFVSLVTVFMHSVYLMSAVTNAEKDVALIFTFVFVSIYFAANMVSLVRRHGEGIKHMTAHILTALGTVIFLLIWIESTLAAEWRSLIYVAWALIFAVGTYVIYAFTTNQKAFYLYGATSIGLIGIATAAELNGPVLTLAFLFEICLLVFVAAKLKASTRTLSLLSLLFVIPVLLSLESLSSYLWRDSIFHEHFIVVSLMTAVLAIVGLFIKEASQKIGAEFASQLASVLLVASSLYAISLVWLASHALITSSDLATMLSLVIYTIAGVALVVFGTTTDNKKLRLSGSLLVGAVIARLLLIEVWNMDLGGRIITFVIIGVLLISTAFINKLHKQDDLKTPL